MLKQVIAAAKRRNMNEKLASAVTSEGLNSSHATLELQD